ncbi:NADH:quinone oxidoreductase I, chain I [Campylobacter iguaniorum]|uniref:NADH-quinone oxidoreductase subunit I n=1 Tax=Campylobacter iguaniorum TaxID=1244531 RepID=A0A076F6W8_9BACT|nr:NADH-quinone oxidoreductase subunit I [Campylobacter iguaniorum]AII14050.1 NADH:quinone oxidoreductase I, chain I [Campylobacter iguaniorum]
MSIKIKKITRNKMSFKQRIYLFYISLGMLRTLKHFFKNLLNTKNIDFLEYPEQKPTDITSRYRGLHRLTKNEDGELKCVACDMCATACPAKCIFIMASEVESKKEKAPIKFSIDMLECVYCGLCVEACPKDAIRMDSGIYTKTGFDRQSFVRDIVELSNTKGGF